MAAGVTDVIRRLMHESDVRPLLDRDLFSLSPHFSTGVFYDRRRAKEREPQSVCL